MTASASERRRLRRACSGVRTRRGSSWSATDPSGQGRFHEPHAEEPEQVDDRITEEALRGAIAVRISALPEHDGTANELHAEEKRRDAISGPGKTHDVRHPTNQREKGRVDEDLPPGRFVAGDVRHHRNTDP